MNLDMQHKLLTALFLLLVVSFPFRAHAQVKTAPEEAAAAEATSQEVSKEKKQASSEEGLAVAEVEEAKQTVRDSNSVGSADESDSSTDIEDSGQGDRLDDEQLVASAQSLSMAFRRAADKALPSVVTIFARHPRDGVDNAVLDVVDENFDSMGSGVIVSNDGTVLTNHHVIKDADLIIVRLQDGRRFRADDPRSDPSSDVATIRIPGKEFPAAEIGKSRELHVGEWVLAIGSPFTLESSVSAGIISGTNRYRSLSAAVKGEFVQTDAAINPGNSGGPLIDLSGAVVGINTAISSRNGGFQGIGFAIPIHRANWIRKELVEHGRVRRGYVGARTGDVPYSVARDYGLSGGAYIRSVTKGYPAAMAGVKAFDVVVELAGRTVTTARSFGEIVQQSPIGEPLSLRLYRDGKEKELTIELIEYPY